MNAIEQKAKVGHRLLLRRSISLTNRNVKRKQTRSQMKQSLRKEW